ncbi:hypothetical protein [Castellaniella defragrans]|uniref:hypothetical protein n=1 Tax=Castellaniella defragrans TaxID=75697 RepID=UPI002AFE02F9|nr:hypothetical protein [Castellaniella defragrans]
MNTPATEIDPNRGIIAVKNKTKILEDKQCPGYTIPLMSENQGATMILHQERYLDYIQKKGVGKNDRVASSPKSYLSYLRSVAQLLGRDITPDLLRTAQDIERVALALEGQRKPRTVRNYKSAMRQYAAMTQESGL